MKGSLSKFKHLLNRRWYIQGINACPAYIHAGGMSGIFTCYTSLGYGYTHFIKMFENDYVDLYYDRDDLHHVADEFMKRFQADKTYLQWVIDESVRLHQPVKKTITHQIPRLKELHTEELLTRYREFGWQTYTQFGTSHLVESLSLTMDVRIRGMLLKELDQKGLQDRFTYYFTVLTQPIRKTFIVDYNRSIVNIINLIKAEPKIQSLFKKPNSTIQNHIKKDHHIYKQVRKHLEEFFWIKSTFQSGVDYTEAMLAEELKEILLDDENVQVTPDKQFKENLRKKKALMKKLQLGKELQQLLGITDTVLYWQDDRKKIMMMMDWAYEQFLKEISKRYGLAVENLRYVLPDEMTSDFLQSTSDQKLSKRRQLCVVIYDDKRFTVLEGNEALKLKGRLVNNKTTSEVKEFSGMCASMGSAVGRARICKYVTDLKNIKEGDILVASMTRPEFVPAMKKASAIITDEGGITCHAAVISRELGKPCIIGTKTATEVLENGMLVEVNADHGQVKILKRH